MRKPKLRYSRSSTPPWSALNDLPLAWDWRFEKVDKKTLREFAEHIYWLMGLEGDQFQEDAVFYAIFIIHENRK
jgi:hypothetical protein